MRFGKYGKQNLATDALGTGARNDANRTKIVYVNCETMTAYYYDSLGMPRDAQGTAGDFRYGTNWKKELELDFYLYDDAKDYFAISYK